MTECDRCLYDETIPGVSFNKSGMCSYCEIHDQLDKEHPTGKKGKKLLFQLTRKIRKAGHGKPFDVIVGISGGRDSTYLLDLAVKYGLKPIAVHYDNGWDTEIAKRNMNKLVEKLHVPFINIRVRQKEIDDIIKAFLFNHVQDAEAATDLALVETMFKAARAWGIKYIFDGHSFRTEGTTPLGWSYMDWAYVKDVHDQHGSVGLETYPALTLANQLRFAISGIQRPRPLYYVDYKAEDVKNYLEQKFQWEWYGGHHLENTYTAFFDYYYRYNKLGYDGRIVELSALIRSKQITKDEAKEIIKQPSLPEKYEQYIIGTIKERLDINDDLFAEIMNPNIKSGSWNYKTYRKTFRKLKPLFWLMMKTNRVPKTFYAKYCKGV